MSTHTITRACGHDETANITGPYRDRERKAEFEATRLCRDCYRAKQDAADAAGLPDLEGTDKQVAWAKAIRRDVLSDLDEYAEGYREMIAARKLPDEYHAEMMAAVDAAYAEWATQTSAAWWIDHRNGVTRHEFGAEVVARAPKTAALPRKQA
jgi:hypothetical protein